MFDMLLLSLLMVIAILLLFSSLPSLALAICREN